MDLIKNSRLENPPREFSVTIPANGIASIEYNYDFFTLISYTSATSISVMFGKSGVFTPVTIKYIGTEFDSAHETIQIKNNSGIPTIVTFIMGIGRIVDNRFNYDGQVITITGTVTANVSGPLDVSGSSVFATISNVVSVKPQNYPIYQNTVLVTTSPTQICPGEKYINLWFKNTGTDTIYIGDSAIDGTNKGFPIEPGADLPLSRFGIYATSDKLYGIVLTTDSELRIIGNNAG